MKSKRKKPREVWLVDHLDMVDCRFVECPEDAIVVTRKSLRKAYAKVWHLGDEHDWEAYEDLCTALGLEGKP